MSAESSIFAALSSLVSNRVYPDLAPDVVVKPYIVYQQIGGSAVQFVDPTVPSKKNSRIQVSIWGDTRAQVSALAVQVEDTLRGVTALQAVVLGAPVAIYEADTKLRGSQQDFSIWI